MCCGDGSCARAGAVLSPCLYDPHGASDSVAESDEERPGSILREGAPA